MQQALAVHGAADRCAAATDGVLAAVHARGAAMAQQPAGCSAKDVQAADAAVVVVVEPAAAAAAAEGAGEPQAIEAHSARIRAAAAPEVAGVVCGSGRWAAVVARIYCWHRWRCCPLWRAGGSLVAKDVGGDELCHVVQCDAHLGAAAAAAAATDVAVLSANSIVGLPA